MEATTESTTELRKSYIVGYVLAIILTVIPFGVVAFDLLSYQATLIVIAVLAVIQVFVHMGFFLHISLKDTPRENILVLGFAAVLIFIMIGGTLWIMLDLHHRMMI
jgi:cytochrome o ubiquinol oxidase operon protein cyoD